MFFGGTNFGFMNGIILVLTSGRLNYLVVGNNLIDPVPFPSPNVLNDCCFRCKLQLPPKPISSSTN